MARLRALFALLAAFSLGAAPTALAQNTTANLPASQSATQTETATQQPAAEPATAPAAEPAAGNQTAWQEPQPQPPCCGPGPGQPHPPAYPEDACARVLFDAKERMEAFFQSTAEDWRQLGQALAAERPAAGLPSHPDEALLQEKAKAVHAAQQARLDALRAEFGECARFLPAQVPMPPFTPGGPGPGFGGPRRPFEGGSAIQGDPAFPADPERRRLAERALAMRQECEGQVRGLFEARMRVGEPRFPPSFPSTSFPAPHLPLAGTGAFPAALPPQAPDGAMAGTDARTLPEATAGAVPAFPMGEPPFPAPSPLHAPPAFDAQLEAKARQIEADCEARIGALFREHESKARHEGREGMDERLGSLAMTWDEATQRILVTGSFLALRGDPETQSMASIACNGPLYVDRLAADGFLAEFNPEETVEGTVLHVKDAQRAPILDLHDNPRCTLNVAASPSVPSVTLDLADYLGCSQEPGGDVRCRGGDGAEALVLVHEGRVVLGEGNVATVYGRATFLISDGTQALGGSYEAAVKAKRIGAEVRVVAAPDDGGLTVDAAPIGDLQVNVTGGDGQVTAVIDSPAGTGKTVSLRIDRAVFGSGADVAVRVDAVADDGSRQALAAQESGSLDDVLDPTDDAGATEYWIVQDKNGFQVLVSFPHFSTKVVTVQSADAVQQVGEGRSIPAPSPILLLALLGLAAVAGRRRLAGR